MLRWILYEDGNLVFSTRPDAETRGSGKLAVAYLSGANGETREVGVGGMRNVGVVVPRIECLHAPSLYGSCRLC